jgi:hypothetical protein
MITYASDGATIVEEIATQGLDVAIFGGDGIADVSFGDAFIDMSSISGITATKPASGADSSLSMLFDAIYAGASAAAGYSGGIYTRETFDAVAIIGLAQAIAYKTPVDDGVKEMLGLTVAGPDAPQLGASGVHIFDENGDVAGSGFDICTFGVDDAGNATLTCHSSWGRDAGLTDGGIAKKPAPAAVPGCMDSTANNFNTDATEDDGSCTFDAEPVAVPGCMDSTANNYNADATEDDGSCTFDEEADEVPGFGLLSAIAALGVALILRRRL